MIVKVCGMREPDNIRDVARLNVDWIGFIFYPKSPRRFEAVDNHLQEYRLRTCQLSTINCQLKKVGVFVNASVETMIQTATAFGLDYLQLHGNESPDDCYALQKRGYAIVKAIPIASAEDLEQTIEYEGRIDYFLFDTKCNVYGGSGQQFDWNILSTYKGETPFLLSGGINPDSIEGIRHFRHPRFIGIDLNSGFETQPGLKDVEKLRTFLSAIREVKKSKKSEKSK
ncbi:phosphoribosylanthranilate isomerase [Parabacteroides chinchillae]